MSLFLPEPTEYDLSFGLFGIPIRVSVGFWALHGFLAVTAGIAVGPMEGITWFVGAFVSILIHELGHVLVTRAFGGDGEIILTPLGGLAAGAVDLHRRLHRVLVLLAGPLANLLSAAILWLSIDFFLLPKMVDHAIDQVPLNNLNDSIRVPIFGFTFCVMTLVHFNCGLVFFNLLLVPPLDGGRIVQELCDAARGRNPAPWEQDPNWWKRS